MSGIIGTSHSKSKVIGRSQDTAKAWVQFNASKAIQGSYNISSIDDYGTGNADVNLTTAMANTNYVVNITYGGTEDAYVAISTNGSNFSTTQFNVWSRYMTTGSGGSRNPVRVMCTVFGD
tara:strand:+ start:1528 stop:1887 length:360 start_codon:yes stop_codon:yes gene_type:complete